MFATSKLTSNSVPPNLQFEIDDLEQPWNFTRKFDYIHSQLMIGAFKDWPNFFKQSFEYVRQNVASYHLLTDLDS